VHGALPLVVDLLVALLAGLGAHVVDAGMLVLGGGAGPGAEQEPEYEQEMPE
jgi:hypothetical protein